MPETFTDGTGQELHGIHSAEECKGPCPIHKPTAHHMRDWPLCWRGDKGIFERLCPHGIGHPDPDSLTHADEWFTEEVVDSAAALGVHGCDGCCARPT
jgi:hypothetical protein